MIGLLAAVINYWFLFSLVSKLRIDYDLLKEIYFTMC